MSTLETGQSESSIPVGLNLQLYTCINLNLDQIVNHLQQLLKPICELRIINRPFRV